MQQSSITNTLLAVIAVLLLVIVIQNASGPKAVPMMGASMSNPHKHMEDEMPPDSPPGDEEAAADDSAAPAADPHGFQPSMMVMSALNCPSDATLTLGDPSCTGAEAEKRKTFVTESFSKGLPIPRVFDAVVAKFGEKALTQQAIDIRKSRGK